MGHVRYFVAVLALLASIVPVRPFGGYADENTVNFVVAPPPVGYPIFQQGKGTFQTGVNALYANIKAEGNSMQLYGASALGDYQYAFADNFAINSTIDLTLMLGSKNDLIFAQLPLHLTAIYEPIKTKALSLFLFGGGGADLGLSTMTISIPVTQYTNDDTTYTSVITMGSLTGGAQVNFTAGDFIISPFGIYTYTTGSYSYSQTSTMSFSYPSGSGNIGGYSTTIFGFDLLYTPLDVSLSSMVQNTGEYTLVSLTFKWLIKNYRNRFGG